MDEYSATKTKQIVGWLEDKKAEHVEVLDISDKATFADVLIVSTGSGDLHNRAIAEYVLVKAKAAGYHCLGTEGMEAAQWVLLDLGDVIVHVFREDKRSFYDIENFWKGLPINPDRIES
jgi:ribosome-associated protein